MRIRLESLTKTYKEKNTEIRAVQNLSLSIPSDTVYGIIGKSGAGKSTLVRLIGLLECKRKRTYRPAPPDWYDFSEF